MHRLLDVDLRLIRIFCAIADARGLAGAQVLLNLSQSRVSAGLAELEARLGVRLCHRGRSGFSLTDAGTTVYAAALELFEAVDRFSNQAGVVSSNLRRVLRIGTVDAVATNPDLPLSQALAAFRAQLPTAAIDFFTGGPEDLEAQLTGGSRDVIIVPSLAKRGEFAYLPLHAEKQSLYCAENHPLARLKDAQVDAEALSEHAFVARGYLNSSDLKRIGHRGAEATVETMEAQLILILSGAFIGYLPAHYARPWAEGGRLRVLRDRHFGYDSMFFAVTLTASAANPLVRRFLSILTGSNVGAAASSAAKDR